MILWEKRDIFQAPFFSHDIPIYGALSKQVIFRFHCVKLPGGFNPSEKYYSIWIISPSRGENHKCHQLVVFQAVPLFPFSLRYLGAQVLQPVDHLLHRTLDRYIYCIDTLQETNISQLSNRNIIFNSVLGGNRLVSGKGYNICFMMIF